MIGSSAVFFVKRFAIFPRRGNGLAVRWIAPWSTSLTKSSVDQTECDDRDSWLLPKQLFVDLHFGVLVPSPFMEVPKMRKLFFPATVILVASTCSVAITAPAQADQFDVLLSELSFGDAPSYVREAMPNLQPAQPADLMGGLQTAPSRRGEATGQATLMRPSASVDVNVPADKSQFDLDAAMAASQFGHSETSASTVGCRSHAAGLHGNACGDGSCDHGCDSVCAEPVASCDGHCGECQAEPVEEWVCVPKRPVNLPRSSFYQYFNARPHDVGVWDGYAQRPNKLYEGDPPAPSKHSGCSGCKECSEVVQPCPPRVAKVRMPKICNPIHKLGSTCDSGQSCDDCGSSF